MTHAGGRPTEYKPEYCQEVDEYLKEFGGAQMRLPQIEDFAERIGKSLQCLNEWQKKYPEFGEAIDKIRLKQKIQLVNDGVYGGKEVNATIVKLMLQNNHGMKEKTDVTTNGKELPTPILQNVRRDDSSIQTTEIKEED